MFSASSDVSLHCQSHGSELILDYTLERRGEENLDFPEGLLKLSREEAHPEVEPEQGQGGAQHRGLTA